jgi:phenylpropionate dioxygenase-like ring-hydroxylating dioxygenase large terminal subunit
VAHVQNGWYLAAWADEVGRLPLQRWIAGHPVCLYRLVDGTSVALEDRCPHRRFPLSRGHLDGDVLECSYHGYRLGPDGVCVGVAEQTDRPRTRARRYPLVERHGGVWLWPGDAARADPDLLPDMAWMSDPRWAVMRGVVPVKARHLLLVEHLLDLSHETFLHSRSIGGAAVADTPIEVSTCGDTVSFRRRMVGIEAPPFYRRSMGLTGPVDRWQDGDFHPPGIFVLHIRLAPTGAPEPEGYRMKVFYGLTPSVEGVSLDFYALARDYLVDDDELTAFQHEQQRGVMQEDVEALEAQELMYATDDRVVTESCIRSDLAALRARRVLERMLAAERSLAERTEGAERSFAERTLRAAPTGGE